MPLFSAFSTASGDTTRDFAKTTAISDNLSHGFTVIYVKIAVLKHDSNITIIMKPPIDDVQDSLQQVQQD